MAWWIIGILVIIVLLLSVALYRVIDKATYMSKKEKDFVLFVIKIYIDYAEELGLSSAEQHDILVKELEKIKKSIEK